MAAKTETISSAPLGSVGAIGQVLCPRAFLPTCSFAHWIPDPGVPEISYCLTSYVIVIIISLRYLYFKKKIYWFRFVTSRSAAMIAALATKLLMLLLSRSAALSTNSRSACVKYTKIFLSSLCRDRRRDLGAARFFMAAMVHRRNGGPPVSRRILFFLGKASCRDSGG